jgi:hypothetical protein
MCYLVKLFSLCNSVISVHFCTEISYHYDNKLYSLYKYLIGTCLMEAIPMLKHHARDVAAMSKS